MLQGWSRDQALSQILCWENPERHTFPSNFLGLAGVCGMGLLNEDSVIKYQGLKTFTSA